MSLTGSDKFQFDGMLFGPIGQRGGDKFRPIVHPQFARIVAPGHDPIQHALDPFGRQTHVDFDSQRFSDKVIDDIERPKSGATKQTVAHEVERPAAIDCRREG